jgi:hypothetical protein
MNLFDWRTWPAGAWLAWSLLVGFGGALFLCWAWLTKRRRFGFLLAVGLAGALAGCGTCHDGYNHHWLLGVPVDSDYSPCKMGCCKTVNPKNCGCSNACPCWAKHSAPNGG